MAEIRVTPEDLSAQGGDLISYAEELSTILGNIDTKINEIIDGWDGLAQDSYYDMYTTLKTSLDQFPVLVEQLGTATQSTASEYQNLDDQLSSAFQSATE